MERVSSYILSLLLGPQRTSIYFTRRGRVLLQACGRPPLLYFHLSLHFLAPPPPPHQQHQSDGFMKNPKAAGAAMHSNPAHVFSNQPQAQHLRLHLYMGVHVATLRRHMCLGSFYIHESVFEIFLPRVSTSSWLHVF